MNIKTYILGLGALSMVGMTSCDTENVRSIYENSTAGITFLTAEQEEAFSESVEADGLKFNVDVVRQNAEGDATVNLISTCLNNKGEEIAWNNDITIPSTVAFKDGETITSFQVSLGENIKQGVYHYVDVTLDTEEAPMDANMSKLLVFSRDYTYKSLGEKTLESVWFSENHNGTAIEKKVKLEQGTQATNRYRVINAYKASDDNKNYPMIITLSEKEVEENGQKVTKKVATVAETTVSANLTVSSIEKEGENYVSTWDDEKITLEMNFVDTKLKKEYQTTEIFYLQ